MPAFVLISCLLALVVLAGCNTTWHQGGSPTPEVAGRASQDQEAREQPSPFTATAANASQARASAGEPGLPSLIAADALDYRLSPLDKIEVSVFQVPELDTTATVSASGLISLPLIGAVPAAGKTTAELEREIEQKLGERYLQSPQVRVFVNEYNSQQATVFGAVSRQGTRQLRGPTSLMQVLAESGGLTRTADPSGILVFRTINGERQVAVFDLRPIRRGQAPDPLVKAGDMIVVDDSTVRTAMRDIREAVGAAGLFRTVALWF